METLNEVLGSVNKRVVLLAQVNFRYGNNVFVPYAVGSLQAYANTFPEIKEGFFFMDPLFSRDDPEEIVSRIERLNVFGLSSYIWNWEYNLILASLVKEKFPSCLIVFGGTHVPNMSEGFFHKYPFIDIMVHHEGEIAFKDILLEILSPNCDFTRIPGLSVKMPNGDTFKTLPSVRIKDLSTLPSPYTSGVFDFLLDKGFSLNVTQETNRGCPYQCTFCDWGGSTYSKVVTFGEDRIVSELEWFAEHKIEYLFNGDANYGIFTRDLELVRSLIEIRERNGGYPVSFRMCTAKKSNDRVFEIARLLNDAGMNKGATLSFQSMDDGTLALIRRKNIKIESFSGFMDRYREAGISTYTELIMGMPGETYQTSLDGVDTLLNEQPDSINLYVHACTVLPNSEMGHPDYIYLHGIVTAKMPLLTAHSNPSSDITEYNDVIVGTKYMPHEDWLNTYMFYWAIQCFHCLGLTKGISIFFHKYFALKYSSFYEKMLWYFLNLKPESFIAKEILRIRKVLTDAVSGNRLDCVDSRFGNIYWPLEEISFLNFVVQKDVFYQEMKDFVSWLWSNSSKELNVETVDELVFYQKHLIKDPYNNEDRFRLFSNIPDFVSGKNDSVSFSDVSKKYIASSEQFFSGDLAEYAKRVVWYGRRGGSFYHEKVTSV